MQQSDQLLITSLKDFITIPSNVQSLSDVKGEEIFSISISFLEAMGIVVKDIIQIEKQKFRSTTKLNQKIHKELQIELQLNDLLNPTTAFTRKTLLSFLSKLGSAENQNQKLSYNRTGEENDERRIKKKVLSNWLQDQWIHPSLIEQSRPTYCAYLFPLSINRKSIKTNILPGFLNTATKSNVLSILTTSINHSLMKQMQSQQNTGITRKKAEENAHIQTGKLIASNFEDWNMAEQRLNKIKRKLEKDKEAVEEIKKAEVEQKMNQIIEVQQQQPVPSVFQAEVQLKVQEKQKQKQIKQQIAVTQTSSSVSESFQQIENPLQRIKKQSQAKKIQYQQLIQQLLIELSIKKQESSKLSQTKQKIETQIQKDQQKLVQCKAKTEQLKKNVEKKQLILTAVESPKEIEVEIKKLQEDVVLIQQHLNEEVQTTTQSIETMKNQSDKKFQALKDLKIKLHRVQIEYKEICEQIQDKSERKSKIKINKSGISRTYYSKKISQIDKRWRQAQREVHKIKKDLQLMKEKTNTLANAGNYLEKEILNSIDSDKSSKTEQQTKALRQIFNKCQNCYKNTLQTLNKINEVKEETREYEIKVHALTSQNYKQGIDKVNLALTQLKKEIQEISKKQGGK